MATPFGHSLGAVLISSVLDPRAVPTRAWFAFSIFAAIAPDLDFLPGILIGDVNRFHHGASHSLGAALIFGAVVAIATGARALPSIRVRFGLAAAVLYVSHLILDFFTVDTRVPYGQPLLWPISNQYFESPVTLFMGVRHGSADGSVFAFIEDVFSRQNLNAVLREFAVLGIPLLILGLRAVIMFTRRAASEGPSQVSAGTAIPDLAGPRD